MRQAQPAGSLADGYSAAQGTLRPVCMACVALSSLAPHVQNGKISAEGLRKMASVATALLEGSVFPALGPRPL